MQLPEFYVGDDMLPAEPHQLRTMATHILRLLKQRDAMDIYERLKAHPEIEKVVLEKLGDQVQVQMHYRGFPDEPCTWDQLPEGWPSDERTIYAYEFENELDLPGLASYWDANILEITQDRPELLLEHVYGHKAKEVLATVCAIDLESSVAEIPATPSVARPKF